MKRVSKSLLMLDYDGTLAPFTPDRDNARPYAGIEELLKTLTGSDRTRVCIISGRAIADLRKLLHLERLPEIWGSHGAERYSARHEYELYISESVKEGLKIIKGWISANNLEDYCEIKPVGFAFHWRGLPKETALKIETTVKDHWTSGLQEYEMELHNFDGGIEIRPAHFNKGTAIKTILSESAEGAVISYLGDDLTDEDAFKAIGSKGLKVLVNIENRPSAADIQIVPPDELVEFLEKWIELTVRQTD